MINFIRPTAPNQQCRVLKADLFYPLKKQYIYILNSNWSISSDEFITKWKFAREPIYHNHNL
jgi:hypothetical protein